MYNHIHSSTSRSSLRLQNASSRCCFAYKVLVYCERGDYNFSLIGSNNACSDIIFIITIIIMLTMNELNVIKIIKEKWDRHDRSGSGQMRFCQQRDKYPQSVRNCKSSVRMAWQNMIIHYAYQASNIYAYLDFRPWSWLRMRIKLIVKLQRGQSSQWLQLLGLRSK